MSAPLVLNIHVAGIPHGAVYCGRGSLPLKCPVCDADFDGGEIPADIRKHYAPPFRWSRVIGEVDRGQDRVLNWRCPDCHHRWPR